MFRVCGHRLLAGLGPSCHVSGVISGLVCAPALLCIPWGKIFLLINSRKRLVSGCADSHCNRKVDAALIPGPQGTYRGARTELDAHLREAHDAIAAASSFPPGQLHPLRRGKTHKCLFRKNSFALNCVCGREGKLITSIHILSD